LTARTPENDMTPSSSRPPSIPLGYEALRQSVAWADLGCRSTIFAQGTDAVRFIDNFTTAAVSKLITGQGTEGFFTDARGWVIALSNILRTEEGHPDWQRVCTNIWNAITFVKSWSSSMRRPSE
jgi:folate-binding Fe-S cluster repair protein YgfZ